MNEPWYLSFGFSSNPFTIKPTALSNELIGIQVEPILEKIENNEIQFIEAPLGSGKTTILKSIIAKFKGQHKLIYASCIKDENLGVYALLKNATLKGKLFGRLSDDLILMVDEAQNISKDDAKEITHYIEQGNIKAVAFFGTSYNKKLLTENLNNSLNGNVTVLSYLNSEEAIDLVRKRIGNIKLIPDYVIREIYGRSNSNPRRLLQNCEDICRKAVDLSINELTITDVGTLLESEAVPKKAKRKTSKKAAKKVAAKKAKKLKNKSKANKPEEQTATVTYSGYNIDNIRTYEEEMSTGKRKEEE